MTIIITIMVLLGTIRVVEESSSCSPIDNSFYSIVLTVAVLIGGYDAALQEPDLFTSLFEQYTSESLPIHIPYLVLCVVVSILVWASFDDLFITFVVFCILFPTPENITTNSKSTPPPIVVYEEEFMDNGIRFKEIVHLVVVDGNELAIGTDNDLNFKPIKVIRHISGDLYACQSLTKCYNINENKYHE